MNNFNLKLPNVDNFVSVSTPDRDRFFKNVTNCLNSATGYDHLFHIIGRGSFGTVIKAVYKDKPVAVKIIDKINDEKWQSLKNERNVLNWNHPNIIKILKIVYGEGFGIIIMEQQHGENLQNILDEHRVPYCHKLLILCDIINGLHYCHVNQIVHLDVKPRNILIEFTSKPTTINYKNYTCKLCDFGASLNLVAPPNVPPSKRNYKTLPGTVRYMAPEILQGCSIKDARCDVYSFGITMWQLCANAIPYWNFKSNETVIYQVVKNHYRPDRDGGTLRDLNNNYNSNGYGLPKIRISNNNNNGNHRTVSNDSLFKNFLKQNDNRKILVKLIKRNYKTIYKLCWHKSIERRPTSTDLLMKLGYLQQILFL